MPKVTQAHVEARRFQILAGACKCVSQKGFHDTTMQEICSAADLSPGAVYSYFSSKEEIIEALADEGLRQNRAVFAELAQAGHVREALTQLFELVLTQCTPSDPAEAAEMHRIKVGLWAEAIRSPDIFELLRVSYETGVGLLTEMVRKGQDRGEISGTLDPKAVAQVVISLLEGFVLQRTIDPNTDVASYRQTVEAFLHCSLAGDDDEPQRTT